MFSLTQIKVFTCIHIHFLSIGICTHFTPNQISDSSRKDFCLNSSSVLLNIATGFSFHTSFNISNRTNFLWEFYDLANRDIVLIKTH